MNGKMLFFGLVLFLYMVLLPGVWLVASPKPKHRTQASCTAYIASSWKAEHKDVQLSHLNKAGKFPIGVCLGRDCLDLAQKVPILNWKYKQKKSRKYRAVLQRTDAAHYKGEIARARAMEAEAKLLSDFWYQISAYNADLLSGYSASSEQRHVIPIQMRRQRSSNDAGCEQIVLQTNGQGDAWNFKVVPLIVPAACP